VGLTVVVVVGLVGGGAVYFLGGDLQFEPPVVEGIESRWGSVGDDTTEIVTDVAVTGPGDDRFADLATLRLDQLTTINGVSVAERTATVASVPAGQGSVTTSSRMAHSTVPEWWARHLNNGERSTVRTTVGARADMGVTSFAVDVPDATNEVETDIAAGFDNDTVQTVSTEGGRPLIQIERTRGSWGTATAEAAPLDVAVTIENQQPPYLEIRDITYVVKLNDVVLANRTAPESYQLTRLETQTIEPTLVLDNRKIAEWWPTHVRNGERSTIETEVWVTVQSTSLETGTTVRRVKLDALGGERTIETSILD
jgi:LEA14-like dessication related protein